MTWLKYSDQQPEDGQLCWVRFGDLAELIVFVTELAVYHDRPGETYWRLTDDMTRTARPEDQWYPAEVKEPPK